MESYRLNTRSRAFLLALLAIMIAAIAGAAAAVSGVKAAVTEISTVEQFLALSGKDLTGDYLLTADIDLTGTEFDGIKSSRGVFDGGGHTVTLDMDRTGAAGLFLEVGYTLADQQTGTRYFSGTVKNLTVAGSIRGTAQVGGIAAKARGVIENCTVRATVSTTSNSSLAGIANCNGKEPLDILNCTFDGTTRFEQGFSSANNYGYLGPFFGYNGGALGGGTMSDYSTFIYRITLPTADLDRIVAWEIFNTSNSDYTVKQEKCAENSSLTELTISVPMRYITFSDDVSVMSHYGTPVVRWTLDDGSYRYLDGFDKENAGYRSDFGVTSLDEMYAYEDISQLTVKGYEISEGVEDDKGETVENAVGTLGGYVEISTASQFESFVRLVNSAVPASFRNEKGEKISYTTLNILTLGARLMADIDLTQGDENGNPSEFYGLGKQEFFPYRGSLDGNGHTMTVDIDAPNGYMIGVISIASNLSDPVRVENLTVEGSITGKTKVGIVGYHDMVADNYADMLGHAMGEIYFENVINRASVTGRYGVGGLLGVSSSTEGGLLSHFRNCENQGTITITGGHGGGLLGAAGMYRSCTAEFENCKNEGTISGENAVNVGGIAGTISQAGAKFSGVANSGSVAGKAQASAGAVAGTIVDATGTLADGHSDAITIGGAQLENRFGKTSIARTVKFSAETEYAYTGQALPPELEFDVSDCVRTEVLFQGTDFEGKAYESAAAPDRPGRYTVSIRTYFEENDILFGELDERMDSHEYEIVRAELEFTASDQTIDYTEEEEMQAQAPRANGVTYPFDWDVEYTFDGESVRSVEEFGEYVVVFTLRPTAEMSSYFTNSDSVETRYEFVLTVNKPWLKITGSDLEMTYGDAKPIVEFTYDNGGVKYAYDVAELELSTTLGSLTIDRAGSRPIQISCKPEIANYRVQCQESFTLVVNKATPAPLKESDISVVFENGVLTVTTERPDSADLVCRIAGESTFAGNIIRNLDPAQSYTVEVMINENACYLGSNILTIEVGGTGEDTPDLLAPILIGAGVVILLAAALTAYEISRRKKKKAAREEPDDRE